MKVVMVNGCFDPLHVGHLYHLLAARRLGDMLIVSLTCDESVTKEKGPQRPVFNQVHRENMLRALKCVDGVMVCTDALDALQKVKPAIFVKGSDYLRKVDAGSRAFCAANLASNSSTTHRCATGHFSLTRLNP